MSSLAAISNNSFEKSIVKTLSFNSNPKTLVPGGIILRKPFGIILDFRPPIINPSNKSLALSLPSQLQVGIVVLAT